MTVVEQAGGIVFRREGDGTAILLVRAKRDPSKWIFPKGHIEPGETAHDTALRETREEAGVVGRVVGEIGEPQEFEWMGRWYRVQYFLMQLISESDETDGRQKAWVPFEEALQRVSFDSAALLLRQARARIDDLS